MSDLSSDTGFLHIRQAFSLSVKARICRVEILRVQALLRVTEGVGEALIVHHLALTQEFYNVVDVGVVGQPQNVVVGYSCLLLCCNLKSTSF